MSNKKERRRIVKELLDVTDKEFTDEELIHQLINTELSKDSDKTDKLTFGQRAADAVARFAGSWAFIFSFIAIMVIWMVLNIVLKDKAFDAYPFYPFEFGTFLYCGSTGSAYYDEPKQAGGQGQRACGK